jgi:hypothetical protein
VLEVERLDPALLAVRRRQSGLLSTSRRPKQLALLGERFVHVPGLP